MGIACVKSFQEDAILKRRKKNNILCSEKCSTGPRIFNFTNIIISNDLQNLLENRLNNVPVLDASVDKLVLYLKNEVLEACCNLFFLLL